VAVLSGPTFAREVGMGLPTAMTIASPDEDFAHDLASSLHAPNFRAYTSTDIVGVEVGGAVKNVLAVGAGLCDGLGFGANTRVALITRGLTEVLRLGVKLGAQPETFMGLAGLGDLVLTCTDNQSRNRRFGLALAAGKSVDEALREIGQVVEGYSAARAVHAVAQREQVDMPIAQGIYRVLYENAPARDVVKVPDPSVRARKACLTPGFVQRDRRGIRQVEAAIARAHGQRHPVLRIDGGQHLGRQAAALRAEQQHVARCEFHVDVAPCGAGFDGEPSPAERGARRSEVLVHVDRGELVVIQAGTPHRLAVQAESQRLDEMQLAAGIGREPDQVAGVGRDLGLEYDQVKHGSRCARQTRSRRRL
jgi:hypothetical protein